MRTIILETLNQMKKELAGNNNRKHARYPSSNNEEVRRKINLNKWEQSK